MDPALVEAAMSEQRLEEAFELSRRLADAKRAWVTAKQNEPAFRSGTMKRPPLDWKHFGPQRDVAIEERVPIPRRRRLQSRPASRPSCAGSSTWSRPSIRGSPP